MHTRRWLSVVLLSLGGCSLGLDPDSLVRDIRVLAVRSGDPTPGSVADVNLQGAALDLSVLAAEPSGPGRQIAAPRTLAVDWYLCLPGKTAQATGAVDPSCVAFGVNDMAPANPMMDPSLLYLASGVDTTVNVGALAGEITSKIGPLLAEATAGGGAALPAVELDLPVVLRVQATPAAPDGRDGETGLAYARLVVPVDTSQPLPTGSVNHNPVLQPLQMADDAQGTNTRALVPCVPPAACVRPSISRGQTLYLTATSAPGSVEMYQPLDQSGRGVISEVLRYSWFSSDGSFSNLRTGDAQPGTQWTNASYPAPAAAQVLQLWVVVQDGRNGTDTGYYEFAYSD